MVEGSTPPPPSALRAGPEGVSPLRCGKVNHYEAIGVSQGDETGVIRRAYLAAARECHPDFHLDADADVRARHARRMQQLNDAWAVLGNPSARRAYDRALAVADDPGIVRRAAREPGSPPPGKGWTPRADDDGWMDDFEAWAAERDELAPDVPRSAGRSLITLLPVALFAASVACFALGIILTSRALVAMGAVALVLSVALFFFLPIIEMTRNRRQT